MRGRRSEYARAGRRADAEQLLAELRAVPRAERGTYYGAGQPAVLLGLGFPDSALAALEKSSGETAATQYGLIAMGVAWGFESIQDEPRYLARLRRKGLRK